MRKIASLTLAALALTPAALAQDAAAGGGLMQSLIMFVPLILIFYFLLIRPQQQRQKKHRQMIEAVKKGDTVVTAGGLIGIGYWDGAVCDISPASVAASIVYAVNLVGEDHVALGSDYDGATQVAFDTSQLVVLTDALLEAGLSEDTIAKVMGGNLVAFLRANLPPDNAPDNT